MNAPTNIAHVLAPHAVDDADIDRRFGAMNRLVRRMLGTVPHAHRYMEIAPAVFRAQNVLIPNMLNTPMPFIGLGASPTLIGLVMYAASKASDCMYCTAHGCAFAIRRGMTPEQLARTIGAPDPEQMSPTELAVVGVGAGMGAVPATLVPEQVAALEAAMGPARAEWIALTATMMGFLNKHMDVLGLELEASIVDEVSPVLAETGWTAGRHTVRGDITPSLPLRADRWIDLLAAVPDLPKAIWLDWKWTRGVPGGEAAARAFLEREVGHGFPEAMAVGAARVRRAMATAVRDLLASPGLPRSIKHAITVLYGKRVGDPALVAAGEAMAGGAVPVADDLAAGYVDLADAVAVDAEAQRLRETYSLSAVDAAALLLAVGACDSPVTLPPAVVQSQATQLTPAALEELAGWMGMLCCLGRWHVYHRARGRRGR